MRILIVSLLLNLAIGVVLAQTPRLRFHKGAEPVRPSAGTITKNNSHFVVTSSDGRDVVFFKRRDQISPVIVHHEAKPVEGGWRYTYVIRNGEDAQQPIWTADGLIAPGQTRRIEITSTDPPGVLVMRFRAPVDLLGELRRSFPANMSHDFIMLLAEQERLNAVEIRVLGPVPSRDDGPVALR